MVVKPEAFLVQRFSWEDFNKAVDVIIDALRRKGLLSKVTQIYGIPRGGLVLAVALSHKLNLPMTLALADIVARGGALIVDDISDSGKTMAIWGPLGVCSATIHRVPSTIYIPDVWAVDRAEGVWVEYPWEVH